jgi:hypothetical protein
MSSRSTTTTVTGNKHDRQIDEDTNMDAVHAGAAAPEESPAKKAKFDTKMDVDFLHRPAGVVTMLKLMTGEVARSDEPGLTVTNPTPDFSQGPIPFASGQWGEHEHVTISEDRQSVTFKLQHGGYLTHDSNGTYVDDIVLFAKELLVEQAKTRPSRETS